MGETSTAEELINSYVRLRTATGNIASALGILALLWSTVVLLGGFVSDIRVKDFWFVTVLSFLMASKMVDIFNEEINKFNNNHAPLYLEEVNMLHCISRQKWIEVETAGQLKLLLGVVLWPKLILFVCFLWLAPFSPYVSVGLSVARLVQRDYGDAGGDIEKRAKVIAALDLFYALVLFQSLFALFWVCLTTIVEFVPPVAKKRCGSEKWVSKVGWMYYSETARKFKSDGELPDKWNLITYGVGLLQSVSGDDHHWGARVLDNLSDKDESVRQQLLPSRLAIQNLILMIGRRGAPDSIENRERAARIVAHLASELHITHFPGMLQSICSLLESCRQYSVPQVTCQSENPQQLLRDKKHQHMSLETSQQHQDDTHMVVAIKDQTDHDDEQVISSSSAGLAKKKRASLREWMNKYVERFRQRIKAFKERSRRRRRSVYEPRGPKELIYQGLLILEGLTQDELNCAEISKHKGLLSKITSPLRLSSHDFLSDVRGKKTVEMLSKSFTVVSRLLTGPEDGATRLRQELARTTEAVSNLMGILEIDSEGAQELHEQALEILAELAFDDSFTKPVSGESTCKLNKLLKTLRRIFLEEKDIHAVAAEPDREKATRLRGKAAEALARLLPVLTARDADFADILCKVLDEILSSKMGTTVDAATGAGASNSCALEKVGESQPPEEADRFQPPTQANKKQSDERKFMASMLSLAVVICNENVISKEHVPRATPENAALAKKHKEILELKDAALAKKLKEIVEVKHSTPECLRVVKLTCQVVIAMIHVKPSCIQHFNEHKFKEALTEALATMSEVDDCMLFAGDDREVIKPARSLASLVNEAQELLN